MAKQTAVELVFEKFNTLSDAAFKSWMLNNHDKLKAMEREQIVQSNIDGQRSQSEHEDELFSKIANDYFTQTYGGNNG